jgi:DNA-binding winged helix-turn-helix (wHTH) protein
VGKRVSLQTSFFLGLGQSVNFAFDGYVLDTQLVELRKGAEPVHIEPKVFQTLRLLLEMRARAVSRDELIAKVWDGRIVSDASISSAIKAARQAIGDNGTTQRRIKTVHGHGFRFVGKVDVSVPASSSAAPDNAPAADKPQKSEQPSIVALPFEVLGAQPDHPAISVAVAHDVIQALSRLRWLRVIARATAFQFRGRPYAEIANSLDVKYCLTGTIEVEQTRLHVTVELLDLVRGSVIWVDQFTGAIDDVHELRGKIVNGTVASIETRISQHEARFAQATPTENLDAWSAFHVGLVSMYRFNQAGNERAITMFDRAIALDPTFAKAHAGRSFAHFQNAFNAYRGVDKSQAAQTAFAAAERSLELDEMDHFANFVRGRASWLDGDLEQGLDWVSRSTEINPNFAQGHYTSGLLGVLSGAHVDYENASDRSISLSPFDPMLYGFRGIRALGYLRDKNYADAAIWANKSANSPGALPVMDLVALIANDIIGNSSAAEEWAQRAQARHKDVNSAYLFRALPFRDRAFCHLATNILRKFGM